MSGNFVQRGEPAIFDKFTRAKAALKNGADAVFELPVHFALQSAEYFAKGAVLCAHVLGCTHICFGSECGSIDEMKSALNVPFASKKSIPYGELRTSCDIQAMPNNMLGIEYLRAIAEFKFSLIPVTFRRRQDFASASDIRSGKNCDQMFPVRATPVRFEQFFDVIRYKLFLMQHEELKKICGVNEGLEHRIKSSVGSSQDVDSLIKTIKSKRYPYSRISRILCCALLEIKKSDLDFLLKNPPKLKCLGVSSPNILSFLSGYYISPKKLDDKASLLAFSRQMLSTQVYSIFSPLKGDEDFTEPLIKI